MSTQPIIPQPTGNPILDNPALKAAFIQHMAQQGSPASPPIMPPGGTQKIEAPPIMGSQAPQLGGLRKPAEQEPAGISMPSGSAPSMPSAMPHVTNPQDEQHGILQSKVADLQNKGSGISRIAHNIEGTQFGQNHPTMGKIAGVGLQGLATIGDIGLSLASPRAESMIPGTSGYHVAQLHNAGGQLAQNEASGEKEAQTRNLDLQPQLKQAQMGLAQAKQNEVEGHHQQQIESSLKEHGFKTDEKGDIVPLGYDEMSESQQAVHDLKASQDELAQASAALKKVQADPNSPQARIAQQRLDGAQQARQIAIQRLGLSQQVFNARYKGTDTGGEALPGAMIDDHGKPVGSSFSQNVRPTGTERNKADMATSAREQLTDIKQIVHSRPDIFGPLAGRTTDFNVWLGSQDPDAQRFRAARTIAGDHLAGTFGGRSEAALQALDSAIGHFKDNPAALDAGLDQLLKANRTFEKAGSVRTAGSKANDAASANEIQAGTVQKYGDKDYKFKGGDRYDQKNWEEVKK